jgi:hypothetical protein
MEYSFMKNHSVGKEFHCLKENIIEVFKLLNRATPVLLMIPKDFAVCNSEINTQYVIVDEYSPIFKTKMGKFGANSLYIDNAGGSSEISEAWSISYLGNKLKASGCIYETEVFYSLKYSMVDYILEVPSSNEDHQYRVGVSVTRAMCSPKIPYTREEGIKLLKKKIYGLVVSRDSVCLDQCFYQSILHIWAPNIETAVILKEIIYSGELNKYDICGTLDIWITISGYSPIFTNGDLSYPISGLAIPPV